MNQKTLGENFILIDAESLSLDDAFMQHEPKTERERKFKALLTEAIKKGVKNFYRPKYDPSFTDDDEGICFVARKRPAVGKSYNWCEKAAKEFDSERKCRLGTHLEYVAFLGVLIKALVAEGKSVEESWNAVCNDSKELGNYSNSDFENLKYDFESTGSRCIAGFCDLANAYKILAEDEDAGGCWIAGGLYFYRGDINPLAGLYHVNGRGDRDYSVGWFVIPA